MKDIAEGTAHLAYLTCRNACRCVCARSLLQVLWKWQVWEWHRRRAGLFVATGCNLALSKLWSLQGSAACHPPISGMLASRHHNKHLALRHAFFPNLCMFTGTLQGVCKLAWFWFRRERKKKSLIMSCHVYLQDSMFSPPVPLQLRLQIDLPKPITLPVRWEVVLIWSQFTDLICELSTLQQLCRKHNRYVTVCPPGELYRTTFDVYVHHTATLQDAPGHYVPNMLP